MRKQSWGAVGGLTACLALIGYQANIWSQPEPPGLRSSTPATLPEVVVRSQPLTGATAPQEALPPLPPMKLPPPPSLSPANDIVPNKGHLLDGMELLPSRGDSFTPGIGVSGKAAAKQQPTVSVEWVGPETMRLNHPQDCQILVRNAGSAPVHNVTVRHRLQAGVTCKRTDPPAATDQDELVWTVGTLTAGQQRKLDLQLVAKQRGAMDCQASVTFMSTAGQQVQVREPLLAVKMRMPERVILGESVNLLFAVGNPGDGVTENVRVKAILPEGFDSARGRVIELHLGNLAPRDTRTLQLPCMAKAAGSHKCSIVATASGDLSASDQFLTEVLAAQLDLTVSGPKLRYIDRNATYQLKVSNPGSVPAQNVTVSEVVPAGFKFRGASDGGRWEEGIKTVSWNVGDLMPGQSREVALDLVAAAAGEHRLHAHAATPRGARAEASAVTRVEGTSALVVDVADVDDPVEVGNETAYEIRIVNAGTKTENNVELTCVLPDNVELRSVKTITGLRHRTEGREVIFDPLSRLAPKADVVYRVIVRGTTAGDVRFRARVRSEGVVEPVVREEITRFYNDR